MLTLDVSLAIDAMRVTAADMSVKYKETSLSVRTAYYRGIFLYSQHFLTQGLAVRILYILRVPD